MLLDRKLDIEHLYAGNKICFVYGDLNLEIREKFFFSYFLQFFFEVKEKQNFSLF